MQLEDYLKKTLQASTVKSYKRSIEIYLGSNPKAEQATYQDVLNYLNELRMHQKTASLHRILQSIKKYYSYLIDQEIRADNPAKNIHLKDYKSTLPLVFNRLLNAEELQVLWEHYLNKKYRYAILKNRNISLAGLLIYQGLRTGEIRRLSLANINLEKAEIEVQGTIRTRSRILALAPCQILVLYKYMSIDRVELLGANKGEQALFISKLGKPEGGENVHYLVETAKHLFKTKTLNPKTLRMSVIANRFKQGYGLQEVQYFAGHRKPSTTERYKSNHLEALQESIIKHHPLG